MDPEGSLQDSQGTFLPGIGFSTRISGVSCIVGRFLAAEPPGEGVASNVLFFLGNGYRAIYKCLLNTVLNSTYKFSICIFHNENLFAGTFRL